MRVKGSGSFAIGSFASGFWATVFEAEGSWAAGALAGFGVVGFVKLPQEAVFALEGAFGRGFVAEGEIVFLDFVGSPVKGGAAAGAAHEEIEI